jgi:hypothetical protein
MDPLAREVLVARLAGVFEGVSLGVHLSLGTAVGGGVLAVLADLAASIGPGPAADPVLRRLDPAAAADAAWAAMADVGEGRSREGLREKTRRPIRTEIAAAGGAVPGPRLRRDLGRPDRRRHLPPELVPLFRH